MTRPAAKDNKAEANARSFRMAVLVLCYNDEAAIAHAVRDFGAVLPDAALDVYDNNSTDRTIGMARSTDAILRRLAPQGKRRWGRGTCSPTSKPASISVPTATRPSVSFSDGPIPDRQRRNTS